MNARGPLVALLVAGIAGAVLVAVLWATTPAPASLEQRREPAAASPVATAPSPAPTTDVEPAASDATRQPPPDLDAWRRASDPATHREFDTPEEAEAFVTRNVHELFAVVWPEIDPGAITASCTVDGRH
ncbi:MAG: hypothetical protein KC621_18210, partial [Myxococcales bacterium]|nr:hypothetical protein [Myxococcales bacterium]